VEEYKMQTQEQVFSAHSGVNTGNKTNKPVQKFRIGTCCVSKWVNPTEQGKKWTKYSIEVNYYDRESNNFKPTTSLSLVNLLAIRECINKAIEGELNDKN